jgi:hypothetical protein
LVSVIACAAEPADRHRTVTRSAVLILEISSRVLPMLLLRNGACLTLKSTNRLAIERLTAVVFDHGHPRTSACNRCLVTHLLEPGTAQEPRRLCASFPLTVWQR